MQPAGNVVSYIYWLSPSLSTCLCHKC